MKPSHPSVITQRMLSSINPETLDHEHSHTPGVLFSFELRFEFLKCFMLDSSLSNVTVEAFHIESAAQFECAGHSKIKPFSSSTSGLQSANVKAAG